MTLDYGHWKVFDEVDIKDFLAFTYVIILTNGRKYAGAKKIWRRIKVPPSSFKRGPKKALEQSDWKDYKSSSNELHQDLISGEVKIDEMIITGFYDTWGKALYAEALLQIDQRVLSSPDWLNFQIEGQFTASCDDDKIYEHVDRIGKYLKIKSLPADQQDKVITLQSLVSNMFPKEHMFDKPLVLYEQLHNGQQALTIKSIPELSTKYEVVSSKLDRLLSGSVDEIESVSGRILRLPETHRRTIGVVMHIPSSEVFMTYKSAQDALGFKSKKELLESSDIKELKPQTRAEFVKWMSENPL